MHWISKKGESMYNIDKFEPGDIFRVPATGIVAWANTNLTEPQTRYFHHGLLWMMTNDATDWITIETTPKTGLTIGLLSWYLLKPDSIVSILRPDVDWDLRVKAPWMLIPHAQSTYGFIQIARILLNGIRAEWRLIFREHQLRRLKASDFPDMLDSESPICTRTVELAYLAVGVPLVDPRYPAIPAAFEQAVIDGLLKEIATCSY
jgi:hypothetical protein